ncbi:hypothetical protein CS8_030230 [Cupriavidus sp. 8B]|jgi:hypothetical protein
MRGRSEGFVRDLSEESGGGPDARHAGQDRPERVCLYQETAPNRGLTKRQGDGFLRQRWRDTIVQRKTGVGH